MQAKINFIPNRHAHFLGNCIRFIFLISFIAGFNAGNLNAQPTNYITLYNNSTFSNPINTGLPVGSVAGSQSVSSTGAAGYNIPIVVPAGTHGMVPQLAVVYNSQGTNGILGMGWNLSGLSSITRSGTDYFHDGAAAPIVYSGNDKFALDGSRLVGLTGTYGNSGATYGTEDENYTRVTSYGSNGNGPDWFQVFTKDGTIMEYGNSPDAKAMGTNGVLIWCLNKITDVSGNYITFNYLNNLNDIRILEINYTGNANAGLVPYNKLRFNYSVRSDPNTVFMGNSGINTADLLDNITITGDGNLPFKTYEFHYGFDGIRSYMREVIEHGTNGVELNKTIFKYGENAINNNQDITSNLNIPTTKSNNNGGSLVGNVYHQVYSGDFNGDGISDVMVTDEVLQSQGTYFTSGYKLYTVNGSSYSQIYSVTFTPPANHSYQIMMPGPMGSSYFKTISYNPYLSNLYLADFNGDGLDDITTMDIISNGSNNYQLNGININCSNYNNLTWTYSVTNPYSPTPPVSNNVTYDKFEHTENVYRIGDFDGDGRMDYLLILCDGNFYNYKAFVSFPAKNIWNQEINLGSSLNAIASMYAGVGQIQILDFDGDGKSDILMVWGNAGNNNSQIYTINNSGNSYTTNLLYTNSYPTSDHQIYIGDFNGDGKADLFTLDPLTTTPTTDVALSTGSGFSFPGFSLSTAYATGTNPADEIYIGDFDGDGKSDIMHYHPYSSNNGYNSDYHIYYSKGISFYPTSFSLNTSMSQANVQDPYHPLIRVLADMDGDGKTDITFEEDNSSTLHTLFIDASSNEKVIEKIEDGMERVTEFHYEPITQSAYYHPSFNASSYPLNSIGFPLYVVTKTLTPNSIGGQNTMMYLYDNVQLHRGGRGFLGFESATTYDNTTNIYDENIFSINTSFYIPWLSTKQSYNVVSSAPNLLSKTDYTISFQSLNSGNQFSMHTDAVTAHNYIDLSVTTTNNTYDAYGNITQSSTNINNTETIVTNTTYGAYGTPVPAKPVQVTVSKTRNGQPTLSDLHYYSYVNNLVYQDWKAPGNISLVQTDDYYYYDVFGNVTDKGTFSNFATPPILFSDNQYTYDSKGRFPISHNHQGQIDTKTYDPLWGKPISETDVNLLTTVYHYDEWGRSVQTDLPQGYSINTYYNWDINTAPHSYWSMSVLHPGHPDTKTWYNQLGQEIQQQTSGMNGLVSTTKTYNNLGKIVQETAPHLPWETALQTSYVYDNLNRLQSSTNFQGTTSYTYSYSGGNSTVQIMDPAGQTRSKTTDATGVVTSSTDNGGTLYFTYDSWNNELSVYHGNLMIAVNTYDVRGRLNSSWKIDRAATSYTYDNFNRLISTTDAMSNTHTYTYDWFGRKLTNTGPEGTITYDYWATPFAPGSPGCVNQIKSITNFNGIQSTYDYDNLEHLERVVENANQFSPVVAGRTTDYFYDQYGREEIVVSSIDSAYPVNLIGTRYTYDPHGFLLTVSDLYNPSTVYYHANTMNGSGRATQYTLGNGLQSNVHYTNGLPDQYYISGMSPVQNLSLQWDYTTLNLLSRTDNVKGTGDVFAYDNLNRLTSTTTSYTIYYPYLQSAVYPPITLTYDLNSGNSLGNINSKDDAGSWYQPWQSTCAHQTAHLVNSTANVSTNHQEITYTGFQQPCTIKENGFEEDIYYGPDHQRSNSGFFQNNTLLEYREYHPRWDRVTNNNHDLYINYIKGGDGVCAIVVWDYTNPSNPVKSTYYVYKDNLGSVVTVTDELGNIVAEQNFDPWGNRRNPNDWGYSNIPTVPDWLIRGFTGQEELPQFKLINLNARLYDPVLGRMLGPDKYVPDPCFTQDYNSYTYARNNPLSYSDPSGNFIFTLLAIITGQWELLPIAIGADVGGIMNTAAHWDKITAGGFHWDKLAEAYGVGAAAGAAAAYTGGATLAATGTATSVMGMAGSYAVMGMAGSAVSQPILSTGNNVFFGDPPMTGEDYLKNIALAGVTGAGTGMIVGVAQKLPFTDAGPGPGVVPAESPTPTHPMNEVMDNFNQNNETYQTTGINSDGQTVDLSWTHDRIDNGQLLNFRNDGSIHMNYEGNLPPLPQGNYTEFVVPTPGVSGPGAQRLVMDMDGNMWYTPDHYKTWQYLGKR